MIKNNRLEPRTATKLLLVMLFSVFLISSASAIIFTETHGYPPTTTDTQSTKTGMIIQPNINFSMVNFTLDSVVTATKCYIQSNYTTVLFSGNVVGNVCNTNFFNVTAGSQYWLLVDKNGASYTDSYNTSVSPNFPKDTGNITWYQGVYQGGGTIGSQTYSIDSVSYKFIIPPTDYPVITINYPANNTIISQNTTLVKFNFTILDNDSNIVIAHLYTNISGTMSLNASNLTAITNFTYWQPTLSFGRNGTIEFIVSAIDNNGLVDNKSGIFDFLYYPPATPGTFTVDFTTTLNQILVILFFVFCLFLWLVGLGIFGGVGLFLLGFIILTAGSSIIFGIIFILAGIVLATVRRGNQH